MTDKEKLMLDLLIRISNLWLSEGVGAERIEAYRNIIIETIDTVDFIQQGNEIDDAMNKILSGTFGERFASDWLRTGHL